ncbi:MAG: anti-sigma factor family protein [bacterium JZ-2024 1]
MNSESENRDREYRDRGVHLLTWNDRLSAFADDALTEDESQEVLVHLEVCAVCRARVQSYLRLRGLLAVVPRKVAPRLPYLKKRERTGTSIYWTPALWALSGATAVIAIIVLTKSSAFLPFRYAELSAPQEPSMEVAARDFSQPVASLPVPTASPGEGEAEGELAETQSETEAPTQAKAAPPVSKITLPPKVEPPSARGTDDVPPPGDSAESTARDESHAPLETSEKQVPGFGTKITGESERWDDLIQVTLTLTLPPEEKLQENGSRKQMALRESTGKPGQPTSLADLPHEDKAERTVTFLLPRKEWKEFEAFLTKHYQVLVVETGHGEIYVQLKEGPTEQETTAEKMEKKDEHERGPRKKKQPLP